jgi:hypothetical protein
MTVCKCNRATPRETKDNALASLLAAFHEVREELKALRVTVERLANRRPSTVDDTVGDAQARRGR